MTRTGANATSARRYASVSAYPSPRRRSTARVEASRSRQARHRGPRRTVSDRRRHRKERSMPISHTAHVTLNEPSDEIDLKAWLFGLSDGDYQACAKGHQGAGVF